MECLYGSLEIACRPTDFRGLQFYINTDAVAVM